MYKLYVFDFDDTLIAKDCYNEGFYMLNGFKKIHSMSNSDIIEYFFPNKYLFYNIVKNIINNGSKISIASFGNKLLIYLILDKYWKGITQTSISNILDNNTLLGIEDISEYDIYKSKKNTMLKRLMSYHNIGNKQDVVFIDDKLRNISMAKQDGYGGYWINNSERQIHGISYDDAIHLKIFPVDYQLDTHCKNNFDYIKVSQSYIEDITKPNNNINGLHPFGIFYTYSNNNELNIWDTLSLSKYLEDSGENIDPKKNKLSDWIHQRVNYLTLIINNSKDLNLHNTIKYFNKFVESINSKNFSHLYSDPYIISSVNIPLLLSKYGNITRESAFTKLTDKYSGSWIIRKSSIKANSDIEYPFAISIVSNDGYILHNAYLYHMSYGIVLLDKIKRQSQLNISNLSELDWKFNTTIDFLKSLNLEKWII